MNMVSTAVIGAERILCGILMGFASFAGAVAVCLLISRFKKEENEDNNAADGDE